MTISVIITTFNSGRTVSCTIESVLGQRFADWQLVIVDGGSSDDTLDVVESYRNRIGEGRLKLISEPDRGPYDAMNKGIALASGDIVGFLHSDDFFADDCALQRIADLFEAIPSLDAFYADVNFVGRDDTEATFNPDGAKAKTLRYYSSAGFKRRSMLFGIMPAHPSFYCRRELYEKFGGFDTGMKIAADFDNLLRIIYKGRVNTIYYPAVAVTMRLGGLSTRGLRSHLQILRDHYRSYIKNRIYLGLLLDPLRYPMKLIEQLLFRLHRSQQKGS